MAGGWNDPSPPFLDQTPAPWVVRSLAWILIALFIAAVVSAIVIHVPETVSSRFVLVPVRGVDQIRAGRDGVVAEIRAEEAHPITAGQILFAIRSSVIGDRSAEMHVLETQAQGTVERLDNERQRQGSQRRADNEEAARLRARRTHLGQRIDEQRSLAAIRRAHYRATLAISENDIEIGRR